MAASMLLPRWSPRMVVLLGCTAITGCTLLPQAPTTPTPPAPSSTTVDRTTIVAVAPPASQHPTLPEFLGIPQCLAATQQCCSRTLSCLGFIFPGLGSALEPKPPLLPIADPANLESDNAAIQTAAKTKQEEDMAAQKIAALRYLATVGCGCYPDIEDAFIKALDDCTEEVRYEAVLAIRKTASICCHTCNTSACCSTKVQQKLRSVAYESDDNGRPKERSERVRRQARLALAACGPAPPEPQPEPQPSPKKLEEVPEGTQEEAPAEQNKENQQKETEASVPAAKTPTAASSKSPMEKVAEVKPAASEQQAIVPTSNHSPAIFTPVRP